MCIVESEFSRKSLNKTGPACSLILPFRFSVPVRLCRTGVVSPVVAISAGMPVPKLSTMGLVACGTRLRTDAAVVGAAIDGRCRSRSVSYHERTRFCSYCPDAKSPNVARNSLSRDGING